MKKPNTPANGCGKRTERPARVKKALANEATAESSAVAAPVLPDGPCGQAEFEECAAKIGNWGIEEIERQIVAFAAGGERDRIMLESLSDTMVRRAWSIGALLNQAKKILGHGEFGRWRERNLIAKGILSGATALRYMKLAARCDCREIGRTGAGLARLYGALGIVPAADDTEDPADHPERDACGSPMGGSSSCPESGASEFLPLSIRKTDEMLSAASAFQKLLRHCVDKPDSITSSDLTRFRECMGQIRTLAARFEALPSSDATISSARDGGDVETPAAPGQERSAA
ncbi:MAG: hypothetical protein J0M04_08455 [Verrucomicrobia bacterium]|nr:hypothetical protein [Verrucomicrobiota bacterium]